MTRPSALAAALVLALIAFLPVIAHADDDDDVAVGSRAVADYAELWGRQQRRSTEAGRDLDTESVSSYKARRIKTYVAACQGNSPNSNTNRGALCLGASVICASTPGGNLGYWVYTAPAGTHNWTATGETVCRGRNDTDPGDPPVIEPVVTVEDFRRLPLPPAGVKVEPPNRRTLVNIPTNLYADADTVILPTMVLGQPVRVRATPQRFRWTYGDGSALTTADSGAPYPDLRTAHVYRRPGKARLRLATVYAGEYSVAGGPWQPIDGLATVNSPGTALTVLGAENRLVAEPVP